MNILGFVIMMCVDGATISFSRIFSVRISEDGGGVEAGYHE